LIKAPGAVLVAAAAAEPELELGPAELMRCESEEDAAGAINTSSSASGSAIGE